VLPFGDDIPGPDDPGVPPGEDVLLAVEAHLLTVLGTDSGRASVTFLGTERFDVLRFGDSGAADLVRYATLGASRAGMTSAAASVADARSGPRAELVCSIRGRHDGLVRPLAVLAASPQVDGLVLAPGAGLDVGEPLWPGSRFTGFLLGEGDGLVPPLELDPPGAPDARQPVRFLPAFPMTPEEAAYKRVHGATALEQLWLDQGIDLRDPHRPAPRLTAPER
jgi:hypothetical protein